MRKTPLSAPGGSYIRNNNHDWNFRDRRYGGDDGSGYVQFQNDGDNKHGPNKPSPQNTNGDDFIPLGFSSPVNRSPRYNSMNWRGQGNGYRHRGTPLSAGSRGSSNSYRNNFYHDTPKSRFNDSNSPKFHQKQHYGQWRPRQKDGHRHVDISSYVNVRSMLEDPWADLMRNLKTPDTSNEDKIETANLTAGKSSCGNTIAGNLKVGSESSDLNSLEPESQVTADEKSETKSTPITTTAGS